tara:strand:+ start:2198 stop:2407 length:210 start_codon:yes stop_codon:yes gene_type:complete
MFNCRLKYTMNVVHYKKEDISRLSVAIQEAVKDGKDTVEFKGSKHLISYARSLVQHLKEAYHPKGKQLN